MSRTDTAVLMGALILGSWAVAEIVIKVETWRAAWRAEQRRKRILGRFQ